MKNVRIEKAIMSEPLSNAQQKCPECLHDLTFRESSFAQYQPSVYWCEYCQGDKQYNYVHWFNKGYERASVDQLSPDADKLAKIMYLYEINAKDCDWFLVHSGRKIELYKLAQEIINSMGVWIKKG